MGRRLLLGTLLLTWPQLPQSKPRSSQHNLQSPSLVNLAVIRSLRKLVQKSQFHILASEPLTQAGGWASKYFGLDTENPPEAGDLGTRVLLHISRGLSPFSGPQEVYGG